MKINKEGFSIEKIQNTILQFIKNHKPVNHIISWYNWIKDVTYIHKSSLGFFIYIKNSYQTDKSHKKEIL